MRRLVAVLPVLALVAGAACNEDSPGSSSADQRETTCRGTFHVLQKDAYKDTAGRSFDGWPPHTTTVLDITCDGASVASGAQSNHGTEPGQVDANGDVILAETATFEVVGPRAELEALLAEYQSCQCDGATQFLGMDSLQDEKAQQLIGMVSSYMETNLTCTAATTQELVGLLQQGDIEAALVILPSCTWASGASFEEGLDLALADLLAQSNEAFADYHVCNNDAALQLGLFNDYVSTGAVGACDPTGDVCHGPLWLYAP